MSKIKVVVTGASGRMGKEIIKKVLSDKKLKLIGAIENNNHPTIGKDGFRSWFKKNRRFYL